MQKDYKGKKDAMVLLQHEDSRYVARLVWPADDRSSLAELFDEKGLFVETIRSHFVSFGERRSHLNSS
jgi:hypothetical protein